MKITEYKLAFISFGYAPEKGKMFDDVIYIMFMDEGKAATFLCPCGCGLPIYLPEGDKYEGGSGTRRIHLHVHDGIADRVTIEPSIKVNGGCNSHFHIQNNKVV